MCGVSLLTLQQASGEIMARSSWLEEVLEVALLEVALLEVALEVVLEVVLELELELALRLGLGLEMVAKVML